MSVHSSGDGAGWNESLDVDKPHGKDYVEFNDLRIGTRKRMAQEHVSFADATVGGVHLPGKVSVIDTLDSTSDFTNYWDDGSYVGPGLVWCVSTGTDYGVLFLCSTTDGTYTGASGDPTVLKMHPDLQWGGGDVTWAGGHQFDVSVDIVGDLALASDFSVDGTSDFGDDVAVSGDVSVSGSLAIATDLTLTGDIAVDGTSNFTGDVAFGADVSVDATAVFGAKVVIEGDASGNQFPSAWGHADWTTNTLHAGYNIGSVDWTKSGVVCVSFTNNLSSGNYALALTLVDYTGGAGVDNIIKCVSQGTTGFRAMQTTGAGTIIDDVTEFNFIVIG